jgi:hypothetical protein
MTTKHPDYALLAARIAISNLHKETKKVFTGMGLPYLMTMECHEKRSCSQNLIKLIL